MILKLTLKKKWFDMIESGVKLEEYREIKPYWMARLLNVPPEVLTVANMNCVQCNNRTDKGLTFGMCAVDDSEINYNGTTPCHNGHFVWCDSTFKQFTAIQFTNGYSKNSPTFQIECKGISIGKGNPEWGGTDKEVFILSLGKIIKATI